MSIIQEALKRAQYNYSGKKSLPQAYEDPGQEPAISASAETPDVWVITKKTIVVVCVIALLALATGFGMRALFPKLVAMDKARRSKDSAVAVQKTESDKTVPPSPFPASVERATERPLVLAASGQANQSPNLVLNGIMYVEEKPKAIINGTVVREGDVISGAIVTSITENSVLLKYNNNDNQVEVALKLKE